MEFSRGIMFFSKKYIEKVLGLGYDTQKNDMR